MLAALRIVIGWHFLYEGVAKWMQPGWSAAGYLESSRWLLADFYHGMASRPAVLHVVNLLNIWGLILIGVALILGALTRLASLAGIALLLLYWLANPPLVGLGLTMPAEGHDLIINKNVVEMFALAVVIATSAGQYFGLDRLLTKLIAVRPSAPSAKTTGETPVSPASDTVPPARPAGEHTEVSARRELLKSLAGIPVLAGFAGAVMYEKRWRSYEEKNLADAASAPSAKLLDASSLAEELKGRLPLATIGDAEKKRTAIFSRVILGGNLLSGNAHSRDLVYVSHLVKAYHTKDKIFNTLLLAEKCGINTLLTNPILCSLIEEYWKRKIGKIQFISDCFGLQYDKYPEPPYMMEFGPFLDKVKRAIDHGACACYLQGETADWFVQHQQLDHIAKTLELIRGNGLPAGIGAHDIGSVKRCIEAGFIPDFWMKTLHHHKYWSAENPNRHDSVFCEQPEETMAFMQGRTEPWIAFKVLAAGAIKPKDAFEYALRGGADFLCVGMYDFQIVDDVNIALAALQAAQSRPRPWFGKEVSV